MRKRVEAALGSVDDTGGDALPGEARPGELGERLGGGGAPRRIELEPADEPSGDLLDGVVPELERQQRPEVLVEGAGQDRRDLGEARMGGGDRKSAARGGLG